MVTLMTPLTNEIAAETASASARFAVSRPTLAQELELIRLERRAQRLELVLRELRRRARHHPAPILLGHAIDGFDTELAAVRSVLRSIRTSL